MAHPKRRGPSGSRTSFWSDRIRDFGLPEGEYLTQLPGSQRPTPKLNDLGVGNWQIGRRGASETDSERQLHRARLIDGRVAAAQRVELVAVHGRRADAADRIEVHAVEH